MIRPTALVMTAALLAACSEEKIVAVPDPIVMSEEAVGHYCQMIVLEHAGPKAQVHLADIDAPLWFSQIRDAFVFDRLPEETSDVAAIYVNDMGAAASWEEPGAENWIAATTAIYVVDSDRRGGMGAPEFVPFSDEAAAQAFVASHGGKVIAYDEITDAMVLEPVEVEPLSAPEHTQHSALSTEDVRE